MWLNFKGLDNIGEHLSPWNAYGSVGWLVGWLVISLLQDKVLMQTFYTALLYMGRNDFNLEVIGLRWSAFIRIIETFV